MRRAPSGITHAPEAEEEMNEAARFYERRKKGLGFEFLNEVERTIASILAHPRSGPAISASIRRRIVHLFPFGVLYAIHTDKIVILWFTQGWPRHSTAESRRQFTNRGSDMARLTDFMR